MEQTTDVAIQLALVALSAGGNPLGALINLLATVTVGAVKSYLSHRATKDFIEEIKELFIRLTEQGYITPLVPSYSRSPPSSPSPLASTQIGWIMTPKGAETLFFSVYTDISAARAFFRLPPAQLTRMGVLPRVIVNLTSQSNGEAIRSRLGSTWPAQWREAMVRDGNPLQGMQTYARSDASRIARGIVRNAARAAAADLGHRDLLLARVLGLAQVCGIGEVSLLDLMELMVHSSHYEKIARRVFSAVFGVHFTCFTGFALQGLLAGSGSGPGYPGSRMGSLQNPMEGFAEAAVEFDKELVQIGVVERGKAKIARGEEMIHVRFKIESAARPRATEGEPIYMVSGWAVALLHRPRNHPSKRSFAKDMTVDLAKDIGKHLMPPPLRIKAGNMTRKRARTDVHGNPTYFSSDLEKIRVNIKRTARGKLVAKIANFGDFRPPPFGGQGVFGVPCGCRIADPNKALPGAAFKGYKRENIFKYRADQVLSPLRVGYDAILYHWSTGDLPMILYWAETLVKGTYVQVSGECMYCATSRALGSGCNMIIAGGW
ncbi:hypothetical protein BJX62DRAFT_253308 [Aspergillus germanicus]